MVTHMSTPYPSDIMDIPIHTSGGFNLVGFTLDFLDDSVHLDYVGDPWSQARDEVRVLSVRNLNLVEKTQWDNEIQLQHGRTEMNRDLPV